MGKPFGESDTWRKILRSSAGDSPLQNEMADSLSGA